ncbi:MAG: IS200/IS605 family transposase [Thermoguttaceae bacterium]
MSQSFASRHVHVIFSTKSRAPLISGELEPRLHEYLRGIVRGQGSVLVAAGAMPDHVHLLCSLGREISVAAPLRPAVRRGRERPRRCLGIGTTWGRSWPPSQKISSRQSPRTSAIATTWPSIGVACSWPR